MLPLNYQFARLSVFEKIRERHLTDGRTDGQTDRRGATLNAIYWGGPYNKLFHNVDAILDSHLADLCRLHS